MSDVADQPTAVPLLEPRGGVPAVIESATDLAAMIDRFASGTGSVAVDAERASGYRYGQRAYLVQLHRSGAGIALIDPIACPDLSGLSRALADAEWVLHAASQDLPSLAEVGLVPRSLFDTELAARLAGYDRVGLGNMVERLLGFQLAKEHSAVDWSRRPLPEDWLRYAALDVDVLLELRDRLEDVLREQGKLEWARQEFDAVRDALPPAPREDPWRRTSGIHRVRNRRQLAVVRALWQARDAVARRRDVSPGRVLPDTAIVAAAVAGPATPAALGSISGWGGRSTRRLVPDMWPVIDAATRLPDADLPRHSVPGEGPPPANRWPDRDPEAAARLGQARASLAELSAAHRIPVENLASPDLVRRLAWSPPGTDLESVRRFLHAGGARPWQVELTGQLLADAMSATATPATATPATATPTATDEAAPE